ncbi:MAG: DUF554 domain-containing protein [Firmicutes bacterium]|nr:DUF554 domain-containing protein [Bacillota bacterium]
MAPWSGEVAPAVNGLAVVAGAGVGALGLRGLSDAAREAVLQAVALAVVAIGLDMVLAGRGPDPLLLVASMVLGGATGHLLALEERMERGAERLRERVGGGGGFVQGLVLATLIFCVGPMAVVGALDSGLRGQGGLLFAKSLLDGVTALFLASSFGWGVVVAAVPVWLYEGGIALGASALASVLSAPVVDGMTRPGGLLVVGIGLNVLLGTRLRVANMLPALVYGALLAGIKARYGLPL